MDKSRVWRRGGRSAWLGATLAALCLTAPWVLTGCGAEEGEALEVSEGALQVTPLFRVTGLSGAEEIFLQDLYLGVGEVRLEPLGDVDEVVYVTRTPMHLHFDLAAGEWVLEGAPLTLPHGGDYLVSVSLEPVEGVDAPHSVQINGLFARKGEAAGPLHVPTADEPMPVPWRDPTDAGEVGCAPTSRRVEWVPWTYTTQRPMDVMLNDVQFVEEADEQSLVITFDLQEWLEEAFRPLRTAVETSEGEKLGEPPSDDGPGETPSERVEPLDVTTALDTLGAGLDSLEGRSEARVMRR